MELTNDTMRMLDLMLRPAFCVKDGVIVRINQAAREYLLEVGQSLSDLLATGQQEYQNFSGGCLYLTLSVRGKTYGASAVRMEDCDAFVLETDGDQAELRALALAAQELRAPLTTIMTSTERLIPLVDPDNATAQEQISRLNRGLYQMLRMVSNMSDALRYVRSAPRMECQDISVLLSEIFQRAQEAFSDTGLSLTYTGIPASVYTLVDMERLERAVYNILANAIKFSPRGGTVHARLIRLDNMLMLTIEDHGSGVPDPIRSTFFSRYLREPGLEDSRCGIGLGMVLVREAATAHGGTVLLDQVEGGGTRITMTIAIRLPEHNELRSPRFWMDYTGERDHGLVELSEVLPPELYHKEH